MSAETKKEIIIKLPINGDLFDNFDDFGKYTFRKLTNATNEIHAVETPEEKGEIMLDTMRDLFGAAQQASWSKIGVKK